MCQTHPIPRCLAHPPRCPPSDFPHRPVPIRRELVGRLTEAGMSTRAIAPAVGKDFTTVSRDRQVLRDATPDPLAEEKADGRVVKLTGPGSLLTCSTVPPWYS